ncbi:MAG: glycosyltransferase family 4 protein [Acidobacteria bacterium]|nr:glycosyltransferase family 4 protein [Acidobacteriota bacterium]
MIKILYLNPSSQLGGAEWVLHDLVTHLDRTRFAPLVILPKEGPLAERLRAAGVEVRLVNAFEPLLGLGRYSRPIDYARAVPALFHLIRGVLRIKRMIEDERIAVVHAHGIKMHFLVCALAVWVNARIIWHLHDFISRRKFYRLFLLLADVCPSLIIVNSRAVAADLEAVRNVVVVHNGVDVGRFSPSEMENRKDGCFHIGIIGILAPWKGHEVFLQAARRVSQQMSRVRFWIVGDEIYDTDGHQGYRRQLEQWVSAQGFQDQIQFTGFRPDVARVMSALDVVVHASTEPEPFGRILIEAMACGKPVIAANAGGVPEIVQHGINGFLTTPGDADQLAEAIFQLLNDESARRRLGAAGRQRVEQHFSLMQQVGQIETIYESLSSGQ